MSRISERLTQAQLEGILSRELCHVRRRDNLVAALHLLVTPEASINDERHIVDALFRVKETAKQN